MQEKRSYYLNINYTLESNTFEYDDDTGILNQIENSANPLHFASPDGYQSIETLFPNNYVAHSSNNFFISSLRIEICSCSP